MGHLVNLRTGKTFALEGDATLLGRDPKLRLCINDLGVSRRHAAVVVYPDQVRLSDLGSRNGVFVNGVQVTGDVALQDGDQILLGETVFDYRTMESGGVLDPGDSGEYRLADSGEELAA